VGAILIVEVQECLIFHPEQRVWTQQGPKLVAQTLLEIPNQVFQFPFLRMANSVILAVGRINTAPGQYGYSPEAAAFGTQQGPKTCWYSAVGVPYKVHQFAFLQTVTQPLLEVMVDSSNVGQPGYSQEAGVWTQQGTSLLASVHMVMPTKGYSSAIHRMEIPLSKVVLRIIATQAGSMGIHPKRRCLDTARCKACWHRCG